MKKILLLCFACLSLQAYSQTDSLQNVIKAATHTSILSLTKADIERLPATGFMALVQGAFPFVGNVSVVEEDYSFLVDGFVAVNPNAINLSQIESIHFYPAGTVLTRGSLARRGTFVIRMQPEKSGADVSTKTGLLMGANSRTATNRLQYGTGFSTFNEASYRLRANRSFFSAAASYLRNQQPALQATTAANEMTARTRNSRLRLSTIGGWQWSKQWSLSGGFFLTSQPQHTNEETIFPQNSGTVELSTQQQNLYGSAHASLRFSPSEKVSNRIAAEMSYAEDKDDEQSVHRLPSNLRRTASADRFQRYYAFTNHFLWTALSTPALRLEASLVARYRFNRGTEDDYSVATSGGNSSVSSSFRGIRSRSFAVSPNVMLHWHQWLTAEAGATYDDYGHSFKGKETYKKLLPNAGLRLELASLLKWSGITSLALSSAWQQYQTSYGRTDLLGTPYGSNIPSFNPFGSFVYGNPTAAEYTSSNIWVSSVTIGLWQNRLLLQGSYRRHDEMIPSFTSIYFNGVTNYILMYEPLKAKNWSVEVKSVLVQKPAANWSLAAMVYHDLYERKKHGNTGFIAIPAEALYLDAGKAPLRGGLRTALTLRRFFLQAAALVNFNEADVDKNGTMQVDRTTSRSNFLLAGYTVPLKSKVIKSIEANVQSQNLLHTSTYVLTKYVGLGLQARF
jgi:hypothetical protein